MIVMLFHVRVPNLNIFLKTKAFVLFWGLLQTKDESDEKEHEI